MPNLKLGKLPPKAHPKTLKLSAFFKAPLPSVPKAFAWEYNLSDWGMMDNSDVGDCTCACAGHLIMEWTSRTYGTVTPTTQQILAAYQAISGWNGIVNDPSDQGAAITDVLAYWQATGIADHKILAWASIDVTNLANIKSAVALFGGVDIGFNVSQTAMNEFSAGQPWNDTSDTNYIGGHSIPIMGYGGLGCTAITWGQRQQMSWAFFQKYCDEAYGIITQDWLNAQQVSPAFGLDLPALQAALQSVS